MAIQSIIGSRKPDKKYCGVFNLNHVANSMMIRSVLADIEQNIFRGTIRNADNQYQQTYTIIYKCKQKIGKDGIDRNELSELTAMIKSRYEALGATVNVIDTPSTILRLKTRERKTRDGHQTPAQKLTEYLDRKEQQPNQPFKRADMLKNCNITVQQFKDALKRNAHIKKRLENIKTDKQGWYKFPAA